MQGTENLRENKGQMWGAFCQNLRFSGNSSPFSGGEEPGLEGDERRVSLTPGFPPPSQTSPDSRAPLGPPPYTPRATTPGSSPPTGSCPPPAAASGGSPTSECPYCCPVYARAPLSGSSGQASPGRAQRLYGNRSPNTGALH